MTRISSAQIFLQGLRSITTGQVNVGKTQSQLATGKRILQPADDPIAAVRIAQLTSSLTRGEQFNKNAQVLEGRLQVEESALEGSINTLQRVRELALRANNATETPESRAIAATEVRELLDGLLQLANTQDGQGKYIFSGFQEDTRAFVRTESGVVYNGDDGARRLQIGPNRFDADRDPGSAVFQGVRQGNGVFSVAIGNGNTGTASYGGSEVLDSSLYDGGNYTIRFAATDSYQVLDNTNTVIASGGFSPGDTITFNGVGVTVEGSPAAADELTVSASAPTDIFAVLDQLATTLEAGGGSSVDNAALHSGVNRGLEDIDQSLGKLLGFQTQVGSRLRAAEEQFEINAGANLQLQELRSSLEDVDVAEAATRFSQQLLGLEAAQAAFSRVQSLSLFNFL